MNNLSNSDKNLLDRLNALRPSTFLSDTHDYSPAKAKLTSNLLESSTIRTQLRDTENDLSLRLRKLRDLSLTPTENLGNNLSLTKFKQDSNEIDDLVNNQLILEELEASPGQISVEFEKLTDYDSFLTEISSVQKVLTEVEKLSSIPSLKFIEQERNEITNEALLSLLDNISFDFECDKDDKQDGNEQFINQMNFSSEVNDVIMQVMDEISLKKVSLLREKGGDENKLQGEKLQIGNEETVNTTVFPSTPTSLCQPKKEFYGVSNIQFNQKPIISAESSPGMSPMDLKSFQLPEKPTFQSTETFENDFKDSDLDTWCIICLDDARIRCLSCDGDLYCTSCWEKGHTDPDVELEERNHRWVVYKRY